MSERIINITIHFGDVSKHTTLELSKINKERITKLVRKELGFNKTTKFKLTRKSKRSKCYVDLVDHADFRALNRSLDVKNHLKLKIEDVVMEEASNEQEKENEVVADDNTNEKVELKKTEFYDIVNKLDDIKGSLNHVRKQFRKQHQEAYAALAQRNSGSDSLPAYESTYAASGAQAAPSEPAEPAEPATVTPSVADVLDATSNVIHPTIFCDVCNPSDDYNGRIKGTRYQCRDCFNYDLCEVCYLTGKATRGHSINHSMNRISIIPKDSFTNMRDASSNSSNDRQAQQEEQDKEFNEDPKDPIYLDIKTDPANFKEYTSKIVKFVGEYDDISKISNALNKIDAYDDLLSLTNGDEEILSTIIKSYIESQKHKNAKGERVTKNPNLTVQVSKVDQTLVFHLQNKSCLLTPKNLSLIMNFMGKNDTNPENITKFNLSIGPHSIYPNGHKRLYYNLNGIENNFEIGENKFTIELIGEDNKIYASGICKDGSGLVELSDETELWKDLSNIVIEDNDDEDDEIDEDRSSLDVPVESETTNSKETASNQGSSTESGTSSQFVTPSNSAFITHKVFDNSRETLVDVETKTFSVEEETQEVVESSDDTGSIATRESPNPRSSVSTLTPEFVEVDDNLDAVDAVVSTDLSDEEDDDNDSFTEDYEVLSTDDYSD